MARSVSDLKLAAKTVIDLASTGLAPANGEALIPLPWRNAELPTKIRVGYWVQNDAIKVSWV
jgi:hypothetical protein